MTLNIATEILTDRFRCARCHKPVRIEGHGLVCSDGHVTPLVNGYWDGGFEARDEDTRRTLESFGYEWTKFDKIQPEDHIFWERYFLDVPLEELSGRVALDAGCGKGRFSYFLSPHVAGLVALDGSAAVEAAARNLAERQNAVVMRADLRAPPFADESFDFICCLGVLHHLSDPATAFRQIVRLLAPGGSILIYVYSRPEKPGLRSAGLTLAGMMRKVTRRMPHPALKLISLPIALILYALCVVPGLIAERVEAKVASQIPLHTYRRRPLRSLWLDTFDRLSAPLENRYLWADLEPWFRHTGLNVVSVREDAGLIVFARKPAAS